MLAQWRIVSDPMGARRDWILVGMSGFLSFIGALLRLGRRKTAVEAVVSATSAARSAQTTISPETAKRRAFRPRIDPAQTSAFQGVFEIGLRNDGQGDFIVKGRRFRNAVTQSIALSPGVYRVYEFRTDSTFEDLVGISLAMDHAGEWVAVTVQGDPTSAAKQVWSGIPLPAGVAIRSRTIVKVRASVLRELGRAWAIDALKAKREPLWFAVVDASVKDEPETLPQPHADDWVDDLALLAVNQATSHAALADLDHYGYAGPGEETQSFEKEHSHDAGVEDVQMTSFGDFEVHDNEPAHAEIDHASDFSAPSDDCQPAVDTASSGGSSAD